MRARSVAGSVCTHPSVVRRPDEDSSSYCGFRCTDCGARLVRRCDEPDTAIRAYGRRGETGEDEDPPIWDFGEESERRVFSDRYGLPRWLGREVWA